MASTNQEPARTFQLKKYEPVPSFMQGSLPEKNAETPAEWFSKKFSKHADVYGCPILEQRYEFLGEFGLQRRIRPFALNEDFFAAILGGDRTLGHKVIFYIPEAIFYFWDHQEKCFVPTTETKLQTLLSQYLIQCAQEMNRNVDIELLFAEFREEKKLRGIVNKAKSLLSADETFFTSSDGHRRKVGNRVLDPKQEPAHKLFIRDNVVKEPEQVLTINAAYENFSHYCQSRGFTPVERKYFKRLIVEVVREEFGLGIRNDLKSDGKWMQGWKGITCRVPALESSRN